MIREIFTADDPRLIASCERKASYRSERTVRMAAQACIRSGRDNCPPRLFVYACAHCRQWHMTKAENRYPAVTASALFEGVAA